uniref:AccD n=4 Tax=Oryza TaxID=4527 RepID=A0A0K0LMR3_ORYPU|nr:acetyl-CoA carboxylase carboxyltransferase beta subunit [Oryza rufipogon]YP_009161199.1 AccD [Oryza punctata]YP_010004417.1 acetyl-CoA carboxylase carboxyltransferase beta subunit [Oryza malampuzhaensis]AGY93814.1 acetyl-CoA carboxylase carboxyltransferase beta subunit [Oryza minuta]AEI53100.1 acetyl-CoA carboxylase carboxyltransferase beta subunit [Oryza rufipogon]AGY93727.1 acetyl-CoA carboxylase carboxyltransferase beta subunit [Oryza punctata]AJC09948.1 AccD [Oryza punctata]QNR02160.1
MALQSLRGSMRSVVGKRICPLIEYAIFPPLPRIIVYASRRARMQRGNYSLIKKPKKVSTLRQYQSTKSPMYQSFQRICGVREWLNKYCMWKEVDEKDFGFEIGAFD